MATYTSAAVSATPSLSVAVRPSTEAATGSRLFVLIPYVYSALAVVVSLLSFTVAIIRLVLSPLPILLYIIAPITTFIDAATTFFIRLPYQTLLYFADALYPLYVLFGVACITGCLFGYGGRLIVGAVVNSIGAPPVVGPLKGVEERRKSTKSRGRQEVKFEE
jgi:hypothetical protein